MKCFRLAPMSPLILILTLLLLALPLAFFIVGLSGQRLLIVPALLISLCYVWVWLRFRPRRFVVHQRGLDVIWPLKHREVLRDDILSVQLLDRDALRRKTGWCVRIGAGGLWGGFGWLWTQRQGIVQMSISRTDRFVWIERSSGRPLLITPEHAEAFVQALSA